MKIDEKFDFGFSLVSEDELKEQERELEMKLISTKGETEQKLEGLKQLFVPLLENLKKDPTKHYIFWPNRVEKIELFLKQVDQYIERNKTPEST